MKATIKNIETSDLLIEEIQFKGSIDELKDFFAEMGIVLPKVYLKESTDNTPAPSNDGWDDCKKESNAVEPSNDKAEDCTQKCTDEADKIPIALCSFEKLAGRDRIVDLPHVSAIIRDVDGGAIKVDVAWDDTKRINAGAAMEKLWDNLRRSVMGGMTTRSIDKAFVATDNTLYLKMAKACNVKSWTKDVCDRVGGYFNQKHVDCVTFISNGEMPTRV